MKHPHALTVIAFACLLVFESSRVFGAPKGVSPGANKNKPYETSRGDAMVAEYFRAETRRIADACLAEIRTTADWSSRRDAYRRQLSEMLSLDPQPERTPLEPVITGMVEHAEFVVEKLQFQSMPGLYVTGNLYRPKEVQGKLPAILYVCGHGQEKQDNVSFGNKTHYRHHGAWFARNGYVCLMIDTVQLGEIEGVHHGTYKYDMWWWNARGYTPAGVEAWNGIRALDYLETRPEVDKDRMGVTGRSGGGAYSWWIAALDDRIKVAVPVAGITNLKNHVVDGCVEGHCDCMYPVNTYQWDYAQVAALVSPRPLLIGNTDHDRIFPKDGVEDVYNKARRIYELQGSTDKIALKITAGDHVDSEELQVAAFQWFNRHLKGADPKIETKATPFFTPPELRVFQELPQQQRNATIHETFVPQVGNVKPPESVTDWNTQRDGWMKVLREKCFRAWPSEASEAAHGLNVAPAFAAPCGSLRVEAYDFSSQENVKLRLFVARRANLDPAKAEKVVLNILDDDGWRRFLATFNMSLSVQLKDEERVIPDVMEFTRMRKELESSSLVMAYVAPRGIGPTEWTRDPKKRTHIRRRFMLLGQTLDGMRVWDVRRALQALRSRPGLSETPVTLAGNGDAACIAMYASLFEPKVADLNLRHLAGSHHTGPDFLNVLRLLDIPQAVAMAAERSRVHLYQAENSGWQYPGEVARVLGWNEGRFAVLQDGGSTQPAAGTGTNR